MTYRITDCHIHVQPWRELKPDVMKAMQQGKSNPDLYVQVMYDPSVLLQIMDEEGIDRVGMVSYPCQETMGFTNHTNTHTLRYAEANPRRLLPYGGVHPILTRNAIRDTEELIEGGIRALKIHPPHQRVAANAYTQGLTSLADIYATCEKHGVPVMVHTGTSIFPGARCKYGNPMELDDVAQDFPDLQIIMAHGGRPLYMSEAFFIARRHKNVWFEVSGIPPKSLLSYFPKLAELEKKVLWGSDWPSPGVKQMRTNVDQFLELPLSDSFKRSILETNPEKLLPSPTNTSR